MRTGSRAKLEKNLGSFSRSPSDCPLGESQNPAISSEDLQIAMALTSHVLFTTGPLGCLGAGRGSGPPSSRLYSPSTPPGSGRPLAGPTGSWFMLACKTFFFLTLQCSQHPSWPPAVTFHILSLPPTCLIQLSNGETKKEEPWKRHRGGTWRRWEEGLAFFCLRGGGEDQG